MSDHLYLAMWDCYGLEYLVNVTQAQGEATWAALKGEKYLNRLPNISHLELRARYNSQRHYEIYAFSVDESLTEAELRELFNTDPQGMADAVRRVGQKIYSDRYVEHEVKIR